jgi:hypothetical protein
MCQYTSVDSSIGPVRVAQIGARNQADHPNEYSDSSLAYFSRVSSGREAKSFDSLSSRSLRAGKFSGRSAESRQREPACQHPVLSDSVRERHELSSPSMMTIPSADSPSPNPCSIESRSSRGRATRSLYDSRLRAEAGPRWRTSR